MYFFSRTIIVCFVLPFSLHNSATNRVCFFSSAHTASVYLRSAFALVWSKDLILIADLVPILNGLNELVVFLDDGYLWPKKKREAPLDPPTQTCQRHITVPCQSQHVKLSFIKLFAIQPVLKAHQIHIKCEIVLSKRENILFLYS